MHFSSFGAGALLTPPSGVLREDHLSLTENENEKIQPIFVEVGGVDCLISVLTERNKSAPDMLGTQNQTLRLCMQLLEHFIWGQAKVRTH